MQAETLPIRLAEESDTQLMERVREGQDHALEALINRYAGRLTHFFYRMTGDHEDVEDLLQETFIRVYRARGRWKPEGAFSTWLYAIGRRLIYDRSRRRRRKPLHRGRRRAGPPGATTTLLGKIPDGAPTPCTALSNLELTLKVDEALQQIPASFREAVVLSDLQQLSYAEAARVAGCSAKTFSTRLARGRERLRVLLSETLDA